MKGNLDVGLGFFQSRFWRKRTLGIKIWVLFVVSVGLRSAILHGPIQTQDVDFGVAKDTVEVWIIMGGVSFVGMIHPFMQDRKRLSSELATPSHMTEDEPEHDSKTEATPSPPPPKKAKKASTSKEGKEKMPVLTTEIEAELESDATLSPPPLKKGRVATSSKKGKRGMTAEEILHYYSSSSEEVHLPPPSAGKKRQSKADDGSDSEDSDVAITKDVRIGGSRIMQRMAQLAKRKSGL